MNNELTVENLKARLDEIHALISRTVAITPEDFDRLAELSDTHDMTPVVDLALDSWESIKQAARESKWMPPEYFMNDWTYDVREFLREGCCAPQNWQLVPKLLTPAMHTAIVHSAGDQTYISWPANCWENALEVAPKYEHN